MKLWVDDVRVPTADWVWVKNVDAAKYVLRDGGVSHLSLDNDLGIPGIENEGRAIALWLAEEAADGNDLWPDVVVVHSANPVARDYINGVIDRYKPRR